MKRLFNSVLVLVIAVLLLTFVISMTAMGAPEVSQALIDSPDEALALDKFWEEDFDPFSPETYYITATAGSGEVYDKAFLLTQNATLQSGRIFYAHKAWINEFTATFRLYLGADDETGADGAAFIFCPVYDYPAGNGGSLDASCPGGYIVAFDTHEIENDKVYVARNDISNRLVSADVPDLEDNEWHTSTVAFDHGTITVTLDSNDIIAGAPLPDFTPFAGYFGFSAATGSWTNQHWVDNISVHTLAPPSRLYVDQNAVGANDGTSWTDAFADLQDALVWASDGVEIWVAEGLYKPADAGNRTAAFQLKPGVALYGGFAGGETGRDDRDWQNNVTVLSGDIGNDDVVDANGVVTDTANIVDDNSYHVIIGANITETAVLDGFTITAGKANGSGSERWGGGMYNNGSSPTLSNVVFAANWAFDGGGMHNRDSSSPTLDNVTFVGNGVELSGGGMWNSNHSNPMLTNVTFDHNTAHWGGGMANGDSSPILTHVTFIGNGARDFGGGMTNYNSSPTLNNVTFDSNSAVGDGGGIHNRYLSASTLTQITIINNSADEGGGIYNDSDGTMTLLNSTVGPGNNVNIQGGGISNHGDISIINSVVTGNSGTGYIGGAGIQNSGSLTVTNTTIVDNHTFVDGGGILNRGTVRVNNSIIWGNSAGGLGDQIYNLVGDLTISYSDIQDSGGSGSGWDTSLGTDGGGNIDADPLFRRQPDPGDGDWTTPGDNDFGDLRLQLTSPAIDAGDNGAVPAGLITDLDGRPRFVDILEVPDTGFGTAPIVDMGAYEADYFWIYLPIILK